MVKKYPGCDPGVSAAWLVPPPRSLKQARAWQHAFPVFGLHLHHRPYTCPAPGCLLVWVWALGLEFDTGIAAIDAPWYGAPVSV
jgi:hypothetical protein